VSRPPVPRSRSRNGTFWLEWQDRDDLPPPFRWVGHIPQEGLVLFPAGFAGLEDIAVERASWLDRSIVIAKRRGQVFLDHRTLQRIAPEFAVAIEELADLTRGAVTKYLLRNPPETVP